MHEQSRISAPALPTPTGSGLSGGLCPRVPAKQAWSAGGGRSALDTAAAGEELSRRARQVGRAWGRGPRAGPRAHGGGRPGGRPFHRLSAQEIRARIIGNVITDNTHWSQHVHPDGTLHALALARLRQGTWHIDNDTLCPHPHAAREDDHRVLRGLEAARLRRIPGAGRDRHGRVRAQGMALTATHGACGAR